MSIMITSGIRECDLDPSEKNNCMLFVWLLANAIDTLWSNA